MLARQTGDTCSDGEGARCRGRPRLFRRGPGSQRLFLREDPRLLGQGRDVEPYSLYRHVVPISEAPFV